MKKNFWREDARTRWRGKPLHHPPLGNLDLGNPFLEVLRCVHPLQPDDAVVNSGSSAVDLSDVAAGVSNDSMHIDLTEEAVDVAATP
eukprot:scaffold71093_cov21-Tisochrysis_lutea.AAC.1